MGLQISIDYHGQPVTYDVTIQEEEVYKLCRRSGSPNSQGEYIPEKVLIRRKGKIWISDQDNRQELVDALTHEICQFISTNHNAA